MSTFRKNVKDWKRTFKERHGDRYNYDKFTVVKNSKSIITINCPLHGDFEQQIKAHASGRGCKKCGRIALAKKQSRSRQRTPEQWLELFRKKHGDKYQYEISQGNAFSKVNINCPIHGQFKQSRTAHSAGAGCPKCALETRSIKGTKSNDNFVKQAIAKHGNLYGYSKVDYTGAFNKVDVLCKQHGIFTITPNQHLSKNDEGICPKCARENRAKKLITKAKEVHGDLYDYSLVLDTYTSQRDLVKIKCPIHGVFEQSMNSHLAGSGCTICNESAGEIRVREYLVTNDIKFKKEYSLPDSRYRYDFYLPELNILIEYDGLQHFKPVKLWGGKEGHRKRILYDKAKNNLAILHNIPLIRVHGGDYSELEKVLDWKISKYYRYKYKGKYYKDYNTLIRVSDIDIKTISVDKCKKYLTYKKL